MQGEKNDSEAYIDPLMKNNRKESASLSLTGAVKYKAMYSLIYGLTRLAVNRIKYNFFVLLLSTL